MLLVQTITGLLFFLFLTYWVTWTTKIHKICFNRLICKISFNRLICLNVIQSTRVHEAKVNLASTTRQLREVEQALKAASKKLGLELKPADQLVSTASSSRRKFVVFATSGLLISSVVALVYFAAKKWKHQCDQILINFLFLKLIQWGSEYNRQSGHGLNNGLVKAQLSNGSVIWMSGIQISTS